MAITETKIVQVENSPSVINESNDEWGKFGWSVLNVQITHSQNTKTYTKGLDYYTGDKTVETTTINYATITYQRDKQMPHYREIAALEGEYVAVLDNLNVLQNATSKRRGLIGGFSLPDILILLCLTAFFFPLAIVYFVYRRHKIQQEENTRELTPDERERYQKISELEEKRDTIVAKAAELLG